jgi:hypothetical protein
MLHSLFRLQSILQLLALSILLSFSQYDGSITSTASSSLVLAWTSPKLQSKLKYSFRRKDITTPDRLRRSTLCSSSTSNTVEKDRPNKNDNDNNVSTPSTLDISKTNQVVALEQSIQQLKRVLEREYNTFFNPMERDYYSNSVTFIDPLTSLSGIDAYETNVNMLSGRTLLGSILFRDARILLHSITGGNVVTVDNNNNKETVHMTNIVTRWTLRFTFQLLPWQPSPSFTGISIYTLKECDGATNHPIQIVQQKDYWDAINLQPGGSYESVANIVALQHFVSLLLPSGNFKAKSAGPELPYTTLRLKGSEYEVRRYPSYSAIRMIYERRDEAYVTMGSYTTGMYDQDQVYFLCYFETKSPYTLAYLFFVLINM